MLPEDEYNRVAETLVRHGVEFVVCGGLACILHGSTRQTEDIDIAVRLENENLQRLIAAARELNLQPRIPEPIENLADVHRREDWIKNKHALVFTLVSPSNPLQIDIFLAYPIGFDSLLQHADIMDLGPVKISVSSKRHLIEAKEHVKPPRLSDRADILFLKELIAREEAQ